ncbi:hypothetical protein GCM10009556_045340 [Acrocarpospora pleiomorpha]
MPSVSGPNWWGVVPGSLRCLWVPWLSLVGATVLAGAGGARGETEGWVGGRTTTLVLALARGVSVEAGRQWPKGVGDPLARSNPVTLRLREAQDHQQLVM